MNPRAAAANTLRRSVREATAKSDHAARRNHTPSIDPTSDKQAPMSPFTAQNTDARRGTAPATTPSRSLHMQLMPEALARAHMQQRLQEADICRSAGDAEFGKRSARLRRDVGEGAS